VAREVATYHHLHGIRVAAQPHAHHGVGRIEQPVGDDVGRGPQELGRDACEHFTLEGDPLGQDMVEGRDAVARHHHQQVIANGIHIADLAFIDCGLVGEIEIGAD